MRESGAWIITLDLLPSGEPPTEFRIFAMGDNVTSKGTFVLDAKGAAEVMATFAEHGQDRLPVDFDHGMLGPASPESSSAAGWFVPELRKDGLFATDVQWTERASAKLKAREYRFLSPAFTVDKDGRITSIINVALTNLPATRSALPLVASQDHTAAKAPSQESNTMDNLLKVLGAKDEPDAIVIASEWNQASAELLSATGTSTLSAAMAAVKANAALPAKVAEMSSELDALRDADADREREALIGELSRDGKLPPALHDWARTQTTESLSAFAKAAPKALAAAAQASGDGSPVVVLSAEDEAIIESSGIDRDVFLAERKLEIAKKGS